MTISSKRAENICWFSLVLSVIFFLIAFLLGRWSGFFAVTSVSWLILSASLIWFVLALQFHQRSLAEREKLDASQLTQADGSATIFGGKDKHPELFAIAQNRLKIVEKWFIPGFSILIAIFQIIIGQYLLRNIPVAGETFTQQPLVCGVYITAIAFVSFLICRYATGMSRQEQWRPLRAGGSIGLGIAVLSFVLAIALSLANFQIFVLLRIIEWVIPLLIVILGVETALNVVMDIYRPRLKDQYSRSAFDSRLLGIISEPGKIFHTAASTIDYQFGFKVSQTWFYHLLERAIVPLVLFGAVTLYLLSCVVVIGPDEQAVVEHFGNPVKAGDNVKIFEPGPHFKWPWPMDIAYVYPTKKVSELSIGFVHEFDEQGNVTRKPRLWGKSHYAEEYTLLTAGSESGLSSDTIRVSIIMAAIPVQYRIKDLSAFIYNHSEPEKLLEAICYREVTKFAASATIEVDDSEAVGRSLLGAGRSIAKEVLTESIQQTADEMGLGVEIIFVGVQGIHPSPDVAADYQKVIAAVQKKQASILNAHSYRNIVLSTLAGSVEDAEALTLLAQQYQDAKDDTAKLEAISGELDSSFASASGEIFKALREAQSYTFEKSTIAKATGERFADQLKAYRAAKDIYRKQQRLAVLEECLKDVRKYVVVADTDDNQVFIVDVQEKLTPSLYDLAGFEESPPK